MRWSGLIAGVGCLGVLGFLLFGEAAPPVRRIALTFDDLPMTVVGNDHIAGPLGETREISGSILQCLQRHHATAIGFVNEVKLNVPGERDERAALLDDWLRAGMWLGNHGYDHLAFSKVELGAEEEQFLRGDSITRVLLERHRIKQRYFRPPYIDTGKTRAEEDAFGAMLASHGYRLAPITVENNDWLFNASYDDAKRRGDASQQRKVLTAYLQQTSDRLKRAEAYSVETFSHEIPLIILMHTDRINADHLDDVLRAIESRGYRYVTIDEALQDAAYRTPDRYVGNHFGSMLDRWQLALGRPMRETWPLPPDWAQKDYDRIAGATH